MENSRKFLEKLKEKELTFKFLSKSEKTLRTVTASKTKKGYSFDCDCPGFGRCWHIKEVAEKLGIELPMRPPRVKAQSKAKLDKEEEFVPPSF